MGASTSENEILRHVNYKHYLLNLSDPKSIDSCTNLIKKQNPQIDALINCAGVSFEPDDNNINVSALYKNLEVNLIGTISFTENILPTIKPDGQIMTISSRMSSLDEYDGGEFGSDDYPAYRISKTALNMYIKTLAHRLKNITVSAFDPGWVKTDMGGKDAPRSPEIPADELYDLVTTAHPTGNFWFEGKIRSW